MKRFFKVIIFSFGSLFLINPDTAILNAKEDSIKSNNGEKEILSKDSKIDFTNLKDLIIENNKDIISARSKVIQSEFNFKSFKGKWSPSLTLSSSGIPKYTTGYTENNLSDNTRSNQSQNSISANLEWDIYDPKRIPDIKSSFYGLQIAKLQLEEMIRNKYLEATSQYFLIQKTNQDINIAKQALEVSKLSLIEVEEKFNAGIGNKLEVLEAKTQFKRDELSLTKKKGELEKEKRNLLNLLNIQENIQFDIEKKPVILGFWSNDLEKSVQDALSYRIVLKRYKFDILSNEQQEKSVRGDSRPTLSIYNNFSISSSDGELNNTNPNYDSNSKNETNIIGLKLNWLLFDGFTTKNNFKSLREKENEIRINSSKEEESIINELNKKFIDLNISIKNIKTSLEQVRSARESLQISLMRLKAGITTQREVVNNIKDLTESEGNLNQAITNYNLNLVTLRRQTGKDNILNCDSYKKNLDNKNLKYSNGASLCLEDFKLDENLKPDFKLDKNIKVEA